MPPLTKAEWKARALAAEADLVAVKTALAASESALAAAKAEAAAAIERADAADTRAATLTAKLAATEAERDSWRKKYEDLVAAIVEAMQHPPPPPPPPATSPIFGVNPGSAVDWHLEQHVPVVGWKHLRVDADLGGDPSAFLPNVTRWTAAGYKPLICLMWDRSRMPTEAEARNAGEWGRVMQGKGVTSLELGNENLANYGGAPYTDAAGYARAAKIAGQAIAKRVPFVVQCDGNDSESIAKMRAAVPDLGSYVDGWVSHSYWPGAKDYLTALKAKLRAAFGHDDLWLTEWGFASCPNDASLSPDSYGWGTDVDYQAVAKRIAAVWAEIRPLIRAAYWYCATDHYWAGDYNASPPKREQRFGACIGDKTPKPYVAEALKAILAG